MKTRTVAIAVTAVVALVGGLAYAGVQGTRDVERARKFISWKVDDALDQLDATDAQRNTAQSLANELIDEGVKLRTAKETVRAGLTEQWKRDRADPAVVHGLVDQMFEEVRAFAHKAADAAIAFHATLSPEQKKQALQMHEERRARWGH